jgi:predicted HD phosphohydrolase
MSQNMSTLTSIEIEHNVEDLFGLFDSFGEEDYLGEQVSKTVHCLQCGMLAEQAGAGREVGVRV